MVKITNGRETLTVTNGAYKDIFKAQGFIEIPDNQTEIREEESSITEGSLTPVEDVTTSEAISVQESDDPGSEVTSEVDTPSDLSEIPLSEMTDKQLKEYANQLGVDLRGITSRKAVRDKIRSVL